MDTLFIAVLITVKDLTEKIKKVTRGLQMSANVFIIIFTTWHATNKMQQTHSTDNSKDACNHLSNPQIQRKEIYTSNLAGFPKSLGSFLRYCFIFLTKKNLTVLRHLCDNPVNVQQQDYMPHVHGHFWLPPWN